MRRQLARRLRRHWPAWQRVITSAAVDRYLIGLVIAITAVAARGLASPWMPVGYATVPLVFAVAVAAALVGFGPSMLTLVVGAVWL
ncbi:MAG: hypothetical protein EBR23_10610, partial [Planctomycetia bacterium]|nr:hypothetical protein [Planctomycetia bacterium]